MRVMPLVYLLMIGACSALPGFNEPSPPDPFPAILSVIADSSHYANWLRADPRIFAFAPSGIDSTALVPIPEDQLRRREEAARERGFPLGDAFLAAECDSHGRMWLFQGQDTLIWPSRPPLSTEMLERCRDHETRVPGRQNVLVQTLPRRENGAWLVHVHIIGSGTSENWEIRFTDAMVITSVRLLSSAQA
jgi:hypothetical protein